MEAASFTRAEMEARVQDQPWSVASSSEVAVRREGEMEVGAREVGWRPTKRVRVCGWEKRGPIEATPRAYSALCDNTEDGVSK
jgi:hypothetical protein